MTIDQIYQKGELSIRSYHACKYNSIDTIEDLRIYYIKYKNFLRFKNCGEKSSQELIDIFNKYSKESFENKEIEDKKENTLKEIISKLSRIQRETINSFLFVNTNDLSVRSKNAISLLLKNNFKIKNFSEKILLSDSFNVQNIKNVGTKCIPEIEVYISIIKDFIFEVNQTKNEKSLTVLKNKFLIQRTFDISLIPIEILESESIFQLTEFLLNKNAFFDETQTNIIKRALKLFNNQKVFTLDEIAQQVHLSRERVRQIRKLCVQNLYNKLLFISNFNDDLFQKYTIDIESTHIEINNDFIDKINQLNNTNFSRAFITYILSAYLKDSFSLVGNHEDVLQPKQFNSRKRHNWNKLYLVEKKLVSKFDFISFTNDISNRLKDRIEESYFFHFKSYLLTFLTNKNIELKNTDILDLLFPICEKIVNEEFEIYLDLDENINFKRNTTRQVHEYAYEALEKLGKPSKVKDVFEKVTELYPNYDTDEASIRASMKRKNGFTPLGRKSIYGLKRWEKERDNFKGGTIKEIVIQILDKNNSPIHISNIVKEVNKYRPKTNERNIITNLKLDPNNFFLILPQKFIGLTNKKGQYNLEKYENLPVQLGKYIIRKHKSGYSINEIQLHCNEVWGLTFQESESIIKNLEYFKHNEPNDISFPEKKPRKIENSFSKDTGSKYSLESLVNFISENQRMPNSRDPNENNLYQFYYRKKKELENNISLDSKGVELKKLIDQYGKFRRRTKYSLELLISFISENQRMPDSRDLNERNLYQFYYRIKKDLKNTFSLNKEQLKLKRLIEKYSGSNKKSKYTFNNLIAFIEQNQRLPYSGISDEIELYRYFHSKKRKINQSNSLSTKELYLKKVIEKFQSTSQRQSNRIEDLIDFLLKKQRMPDSRDPNEKRFYQFYYRKKKELENNSSLNSEQLKLKKLIEKYGRSRRSSKYNLNNLIAFIKENQRMPDSRDPNEKNLYQFYYRKRKLYSQNKLEPKEVSEFVLITKLLNELKYENKRN